MKENHVIIARKSFFSCGVERSDCGNSGFNYCFEVFIEGPIDPITGLVINLTDVKEVLSTVTCKLDQKHLNYDLKLDKVDLPGIHQHIHNLFEIEFNRSSLKNIDLIKTKLTEGLFDFSEITV